MKVDNVKVNVGAFVMQHREDEIVINLSNITHTLRHGRAPHVKRLSATPHHATESNEQDC